MVVRPSTFRTAWQLWTRSAAPKVRDIAPNVQHQVKGAFHLPRPSHLPASAPPSSFRTAFHSFARSVSDGVFKSFKTGGNYNGRLVQSQPTHRGFDSVIRAARARPSSRFGPTPRPTAYPSHVSHMGLGAARNFSSARPLFQNIVENVPLGLRALVDQGGIDERKWRTERGMIRRNERKAAQKGKGRQLEKSQWQQDFSTYFDAPTAPVEEVEADSLISHPVVLVLPLEPSFSLGSSDFTPLYENESNATSYRILSPSTLQSFLDIESSYATHTKLIRALSNRLSSAGVFDDPDVTVEMRFWSDGYKEVQVAFGGWWTKRDVEQAAGVWQGESTWFTIKGLRESEEYHRSTDSLFGVEKAFGSEEEGEVDCAAASSPDSSVVHDEVANTLILPSFYTHNSTSFSSLPSLTEDDDEETSSPIRAISPDPSHWDDDLGIAPSTSYSTATIDSDGQELQDTSGWDQEFSRSSDGDGFSENSYESGVREFLAELDEVEVARGLGRRDPPAMFARM